jgi:IclR family transcriptional regulator, pca regulon regulatory protein
MSIAERSKDYVQSLDRGLAVLTAFSALNPRLSLTEVARLTGLNRATARRLLLTLEQLGYVRVHNRQFELTSKVLDLGHAYLSSHDIGANAQAEMERLVERAHESSSASVLDGTEIVYVVRVPTKRIMTISLGVGSRLPAYATSMGRVLLAELCPAELDEVLAASDMRKLTSRTLASPEELCAELARVHRQGWALVDQELEEGLRAIAAPIKNGRGEVVAAMNLSAHAGRVTLRCLRNDLLPLLLETAERVSDNLARTPTT